MKKYLKTNEQAIANRCHAMGEKDDENNSAGTFLLNKRKTTIARKQEKEIWAF